MLHKLAFNKRDAMKLLRMAEGLINTPCSTIFPAGNDRLSSSAASGPGSKTNVSLKTLNLNVSSAWRSSSKNENWPPIGEVIAKEDIQPDASRCLKPIRTISLTTLSDGFGGQQRCLPPRRNGWTARSSSWPGAGRSVLKCKGDTFRTSMRLPSHRHRNLESSSFRTRSAADGQLWCDLTDFALQVVNIAREGDMAERIPRTFSTITLKTSFVEMPPLKHGKVLGLSHTSHKAWKNLRFFHISTKTRTNDFLGSKKPNK